MKSVAGARFERATFGFVQFMLFGNVVPESFQTNSCMGLTLRPQHRGHTLRKLQSFSLTFS